MLTTIHATYKQTAKLTPDIGADSIGGDRPHGQKGVGAMPSSRPHRNFVVIFETVKCTLKIRIYHYANDKSCAYLSLKMHQKRCGRASPGSAGGAYSAPSDLLAKFKSRDMDKGRRKGEDTRG